MIEKSIIALTQIFTDASNKTTPNGRYDKSANTLNLVLDKVLASEIIPHLSQKSYLPAVLTDFFTTKAVN
jgi:hypothetical protein